MTSRSGEKDGKRSDSGRGRGLSLGEKIAIPVILILTVWAVYSFSQPSQVTSLTQTSLALTVTSNKSDAPDFTLPVVGANGPTGQQVSLSSFAGKLFYWNSWSLGVRTVRTTSRLLKVSTSSLGLKMLSSYLWLVLGRALRLVILRSSFMIMVLAGCICMILQVQS